MTSDVHTAEAGADSSLARLRLGRDIAPAKPIELRAGPVTALLHEGDLRHVRIGDVELAQRIYVAVRDEVWNTIPGTIGNLQVDARDEEFEVAFDCEHRHGDIDFLWSAEIRGGRDGAIAYRMLGQARSAFRFAKIGLNVHHPLRECLGRPYTAHTTEGELRGTLPTDIAPQLVVDGNLTGIFAPYDALAISLAGGLELDFRFAGEVFELQDHRNWTDANFKSYCTPVNLPWPFDAHPGQRIEQSVELSLGGAVAPAARGAGRAEATVRLGEGPAHALPPIGLGLPEAGAEHDPDGIELLRGLRPAHLRADIAVAQDGAVQGAVAQIERALQLAGELGARLELGLFVEDGAADRVAELELALAGAAERIARVLVFAGGMGFSSTSGTTTPAALMDAVRARLGQALPGVPLVGGTNQFFTELNRQHPEASAMDGLVYSINPQVHAADDWSLMENALAQGETVEMARKLAADLPIHVSPVTLIGRYGPFPAGPPSPGGPAANVDARQGALFCAAWTVASVAQLTRAGAASITYFETVGPSGVLPGAARAGEAFPVYHVLADVAELGDAQALPVELEETGSLAALALRGGNGRELLLVANLGHRACRVRVQDGGLRRTGVRLLDVASAPEAISRPPAFRDVDGGTDAEQTSWELEPYAVLRLTYEQEPAKHPAG